MSPRRSRLERWMLALPRGWVEALHGQCALRSASPVSHASSFSLPLSTWRLFWGGSGEGALLGRERGRTGGRTLALVVEWC